MTEPNRNITLSAILSTAHGGVTIWVFGFGCCSIASMALERDAFWTAGRSAVAGWRFMSSCAWRAGWLCAASAAFAAEAFAEVAAASACFNWS